MYFTDEIKIYIKSGDGGNGCVSFHREKYIEFGGPNGGNGGHGGSVVLVSDAHINTLSYYRRKREFIAKNGENGKGKDMTGKSASSLILKVPVGTQVFSVDGNFLLYDFTKDLEEFEIIKGGGGGLGNTHFKSSVNKAPRIRTEGEKGEELEIWLKLKLISDVGIIGLPNAGKSTLLACSTSAKPKIADYPFTTLSPLLGVVYIGDDEFVLADIPGLIEGASLGHGLGDKFLKHIERCKILIHLIDATSADVVKDYKIVRYELESYSKKLKDKVEIICLNKADMLAQDEIEEKIIALKDFTEKNVFSISAYTKLGIKQLLQAVFNEIRANIS